MSLDFLHLVAIIPVLTLIQLGYAIQFLSLAILGLAQKAIMPAFFANVTRLVCFIISVGLLTLNLVAHVSELCYLGQLLGPAAAVFMFVILPFNMMLLLRWGLKNNARHVLIHSILMLPLYTLVVLIDLETFLLPSLLVWAVSWVMTTVFLALIGLEKVAALLHNINKTYLHKYTIYVNIIASLRGVPRRLLVLSTVCSLNLSLLNVGYVLNQDFSFHSVITTVLIIGGLLTQALLACELIGDTQRITYRWGFFVQMYLNLYERFLHLCKDYKANRLGGVRLTHAMVIVALAFANVAM